MEARTMSKRPQTAGLAGSQKAETAPRRSASGDQLTSAALKCECTCFYEVQASNSKSITQGRISRSIAIRVRQAPSFLFNITQMHFKNCPNML